MGKKNKVETPEVENTEVETTETVTPETEVETPETSEEETVENVEVVETPTLVEDGDFTVVSTLKHNGQRYDVGDTITLSATEATKLVADGVVK